MPPSFGPPAQPGCLFYGDRALVGLLADAAQLILRVMDKEASGAVLQYTGLSVLKACTVLIASADVLPTLKERTTSSDAELIAFTDAEALRALEAITNRKPALVALDRVFAGTPRGAALINRIKADPNLKQSEILVISPDSDFSRFRSHAHLRGSRRDPGAPPIPRGVPLSASSSSQHMSRRAAVFAPTPHSEDTGSGCRNSSTSEEGTTIMPSGLHMPEASFARNFVGATPTEQVTPWSANTRDLTSSPMPPGVRPKRRSAPPTSRNA